MNDYVDNFKQKIYKKVLNNSAFYNFFHTNTFNNAHIEKSKISVIIPTYNRLNFLTELINSIFSQTYNNFEIILIDDMSNDGTYETYNNFYDRRLKYYRNYEKLGVGLNRQKGYNLSTGDYIIFCDDDDYFIDNNYFYDIIQLFKDKSINVICSESYTYYEKEDKYVPYNLNFEEKIVDSIEYLKNFMIKYEKPTSLFPAAFRRKILIDAEFKEMTMMNDTPIYLRALMMGGKTFINKKSIGIYRIHGKNVTFDVKSDFIIRNLEEKRKIYEYLKEQDAISNLDDWYAKQIFITVNYYLNYVGDVDNIDDVLNWVWKNVSYEEYLKYKKRTIESYGVKTYYWKEIPNFGDMLNEDILSSIFNLKFEFATFKNADLCCVGSILDHFIINSDNKLNEKNKPFHIWGTGIMYHYDRPIQLSERPYIIHALRGEKTRKQLSEILGKNISCVLADPGILSSLIVEPCEKKYNVGIVPHFHDKKEEIFEKMLDYYPNSIIIDVQNEPKKVLKEISQCEYIISTSLHGLVVADSYRIPNCWCEISDRVEGNGFKFHDYFSSFGTDKECFNLRNGKLPDIEKNFKCNFKSFNQLYEKQKELMDCFPFKL